MLHFLPLAIVSADIDYLLNVDIEAQRYSSAKFLLKLKELRQVSQVVINEVVDGWSELFSSTVDRIHAGVRDKLACNGINPDDIDGLSDVFSAVPHPFLDLETVSKQNKFYKEHMGLVVSCQM